MKYSLNKYGLSSDKKKHFFYVFIISMNLSNVNTFKCIKANAQYYKLSTINKTVTTSQEEEEEKDTLFNMVMNDNDDCDYDDNNDDALF